MKILLATTAITLNGGGIASYNNELYSALKLNNTFHLLTTENIISFEGFEKIYSLHIIRHKSYSDCKVLINRINTEHYDLIINSDSSLITIISPFLIAPIITVSHTYNNMPAIEAGFNHNYVSKIIALSAAGKSFIENYFRIKDPDKVSFIYNFIQNSEESFSEDKSMREVLQIVYPGGASMMKHPEMVLSAVNKLLKTNLDFKFYWLGGLTLPLHKISLPQNLDNLAYTDPRLIFTGRIKREEALKYIKSANIFILPSRAEGCPMSLIEALSYGCIPVVGSAKHVCREILEEGDFGVIVKQGSAKDLYEKIKDIIINHKTYNYNYEKTYNFSKYTLSEEVWLQKMNIVINESINKIKNTIPLNARNFYSSKIRFMYHANKMILKDRLLSIYGYLYFNIHYLMRNKHEN